VDFGAIIKQQFSDDLIAAVGKMAQPREKPFLNLIPWVWANVEEMGRDK